MSGREGHRGFNYAARPTWTVAAMLAQASREQMALTSRCGRGSGPIHEFDTDLSVITPYGPTLQQASGRLGLKLKLAWYRRRVRHQQPRSTHGDIRHSASDYVSLV